MARRSADKLSHPSSPALLETLRIDAPSAKVTLSARAIRSSLDHVATIDQIPGLHHWLRCRQAGSAMMASFDPTTRRSYNLPSCVKLRARLRGIALGSGRNWQQAEAGDHESLHVYSWHQRWGRRLVICSSTAFLFMTNMPDILIAYGFFL